MSAHPDGRTAEGIEYTLNQTRASLVNALERANQSQYGTILHKIDYQMAAALIPLVRELERDLHACVEPRGTRAIIVNGARVISESEYASYDWIVLQDHRMLAARQNGHVPTVSFYHGPRENPAGSLVPGKTIRLAYEMVFNIALTGAA